MGGDDMPEDVVGGMNKGLQQNWISKNKYAILLADCPTHGRKFYSGRDDRYPEGCPNGLVIEDIIKRYAEKDICFNAVKITNETDRMYACLGEEYKKVAGKPMGLGDLGHSIKDFQFFVTSTITSSISSSEGLKSQSLLNKLLSLSSKKEYSIIDEVMSKVSNKISSYEKSLTKSAGFDIISSDNNEKGLTSQFEVIPELGEDDILEEVKDIDLKDDDQEADKQREIND
ncbi:MAG: hypothetical protein ACMG6E_09545 [Candidatus Roizmanbacteria bacterium]